MALVANFSQWMPFVIWMILEPEWWEITWHNWNHLSKIKDQDLENPI